jgi:alginate O-acetyltransferase complex protein AlgI
MITMLLGGLWHGANWTFVAWGAYHGILLVATRYSEAFLTLWPVALRKSTTFLLVVVGWVLFRSASFSMASGLLTTMFSWRPGIHLDTGKSLVVLLLISGGLAHFWPNTFELRHRWSPLQAFALGVLFLVCIVFIFGGQESPFLYFQF